MSELTVAPRYAKSLIDLAQEQNQVEEVREDMGLFLHTLKANTELKTVLANPIVPHIKKLKILEEVFSDKVTKLSIAFFKIMVNKSRGDILYFTAQEFINLYDIKKHIVRAHVVSATILSEQNKQTMIAEIKDATGGTVILDVKTDPSLIGGFVLTVGDKQVDTSISSNLNKLKKEFAQRVISN